jgi:NAD-dependent SIR2 family protein deacetylase
MDMAMAAGAMTVQINPNATGYDNAVTVAIQGPAGIVLPRIVEETWKAN